jgi:hypothetical protein
VRNPLAGRTKEPDLDGANRINDHPSVRVAVYDSLGALPRVVELEADDYREFVELMANKTYELSQAKGGAIPFTVIREVVENLMHAYFEECVITILDDGNTIRIADQGPGIADKTAAFIPGFTTATGEMKQVIRGVGSGLPVAREMLSTAGGKIVIEDNLERGAVVTLSLQREETPEPAAEPRPQPEPVAEAPATTLTDRQKRVLFLITELDSAGPSKIQDELGISLSSAYRDLNVLQELGLIGGTPQGKRALTSAGVDYLEHMEG